MRAWIAWQVLEYDLAPVPLDNFLMTGIELCSQSELDFQARAQPNARSGETLYAQLDIWKTGECLYARRCPPLTRVPR